MSHVPSSWSVTSLGELLVELRSGIFVSRPGIENTGRPILRISAVRPMALHDDDVRYVPASTVIANEANSRIDEGDLLFTRYSGNPEYVGACARVRHRAPNLLYPDKLIRGRVIPGLVDPGYLEAVMSAPQTRAVIRRLLKTTAGQVGISGSDLRSVPVPIAPYCEQLRIVAAIEEQFSRLYAGVAALERVRQNLKRMRAAVLVDAFAHLETTLSATSGQELFPYVTSGSRGWAKYYSSDGPEFLRIGNVPRTGIDLDIAEVQRVNPPANAEGRRTRVQSGDLLISITADLGRVAVIPPTLGEAYINQHLALARPIDGAVPRYLGWYLASPFGLRQWDNLRRGATKIGLGLDDIRSLRIPIPTSDVQQSTVDVIEAAWEGFQWLEQSLIDCERRAQHLRSSLLTAAFSGRLVAQDPTDEPAAILLERIAAERASSNGDKPAWTRKPRLRREGVTA